MSVTGAVRRLEPRDSDGVLAAFLSSPDMGRQGLVRTASESDSYVARLLDPENHQVAWAVVDESDSLIGLIALTIDTANANGWFWYWMNARFRGLGLTSRAAATVANWALSDGGVHRLELGHRANNPASRGVALAAGFIQEGVEREKFLVEGARLDVLTYSRLRTDPVPPTPNLQLK